MTLLGFALLLLGAVLVVAEAHVPSGALGVAGGVMLMIGGIVAIAAVGGSAAVGVTVGIVLGAAAGGWTLFVTRQAASGRRALSRTGSEGLAGRVGVIRGWSGLAGQVFVDGALWRARCEPLLSDGVKLQDGDRVVVEYVRGLTLCVRPAEDWELNR
jgi:membrane-bound serine protease (ClpP class)